MAVYAEWWWTCDLCDNHGQEPWGDQQDAEKEHAEHMREAHLDHVNRSEGGI